jgi:hypothetical protein
MTTQSRQRRWTPLAIFAVIMGFVVWWPLGLLAIGYILWGGSIDGLLDNAAEEVKAWLRRKPGPGSSGNAAFDSYKAETLKRLEEEEAAFAAYVQKLRDARDRSEFERFLAERNASR